MLWRMTARASLETPRNGRAGIPRRGSPEAVGRGVDEVDAVTLPAPRRRPRPACDPRAPSADVAVERHPGPDHPLGLEPIDQLVQIHRFVLQRPP